MPRKEREVWPKVIPFPSKRVPYPRIDTPVEKFQLIIGKVIEEHPVAGTTLRKGLQPRILISYYWNSVANDVPTGTDATYNCRGYHYIGPNQPILPPQPHLHIGHFS